MEDAIKIELAKIFCRSRITSTKEMTEHEFAIDCYNKVWKNEILFKAIDDGFQLFRKQYEDYKK